MKSLSVSWSRSAFSNVSDSYMIVAKAPREKVCSYSEKLEMHARYTDFLYLPFTLEV